MAQNSLLAPVIALLAAYKTRDPDIIERARKRLLYRIKMATAKEILTINNSSETWDLWPDDQVTIVELGFWRYQLNPQVIEVYVDIWDHFYCGDPAVEVSAKRLLARAKSLSSRVRPKSARRDLRKRFRAYDRRWRNR